MATQHDAPSADRACVLVVEDDPLLRRMILRILEWWDLDVIEAYDGQVAVDRFREQPARPDAVLLDIMLPRLGGVDVARELHDRRPDLPVIACSAAFEPAIISELNALGVAECIEKPFNAETLRGALGRALGPRLPDPTLP